MKEKILVNLQSSLIACSAYVDVLIKKNHATIKHLQSQLSCRQYPLEKSELFYKKAYEIADCTNKIAALQVFQDCTKSLKNNDKLELLENFEIGKYPQIELQLRILNFFANVHDATNDSIRYFFKILSTIMDKETFFDICDDDKWDLEVAYKYFGGHHTEEEIIDNIMCCDPHERKLRDHINKILGITIFALD
ncbi:hypothetical protein TVAG_161000 [Trichomonas vaginalis G3]|uniref:Uncharacterized protein n=1 Tax=Trichomonas vaginalis (strain ATCC PRA-98 / G3) TaxID=412133 RepID=A2E4V5_TRIV3|nr:hypothetical protein TVAGG3_0227980 [Trichomonas vaginalis G3]EAY12294.1 hypothetical protein TVAG_161000 [Trichomonas vaginalis G3]KAI5552408.1 hypothetical protein TVAGG3_0227980 [Trichomonas vaginalis G3]|eukprot:XP_001324517.1 hypothetical protein [Trichomonas vaginalis G3]